MLVPALLHKEEIERKFAEVMYSDEYFYYLGYAHGHELPRIEPRDNQYQWAIVNKDGNLIGYLAYTIIQDTDTVTYFGMFGFDGNPVLGFDVVKHLEELIAAHRRIEWRCIGGNPVLKHYKKFCRDHNGDYVILHDVVKDNIGNYWDEYIFEIVN